MQKHPRPFFLQNGFTLVETALVLAIVGAIIGGIWIGAATIQGNIKKNKVSEQTLKIAQNVKNYYQNQRSTAELSTATIQRLIDIGLIPDDMIRGAAGAPSIVHAYGGNVLLAPTNSAIGVTNAGFVIGLENIPLDACVDMLSARLGGNAASAKKIGFFGYAGNDPDEGGEARIFPINLQIAKTTCRGGDDYDAATNTTTLSLYFEVN